MARKCPMFGFGRAAAAPDELDSSAGWVSRLLAVPPQRRGGGGTAAPLRAHSAYLAHATRVRAAPPVTRGRREGAAGECAGASM
eukprot:gene56101-61371_t